ncbi:MAG: hypothetical protein WD607_09945 [Candidatus Paceibacterota bacterium]
MTSEEYLDIREIAKHLASKIFEWEQDKLNYLSEGTKLGLVSNRTIVFDDDSDTENLQDYMMYNSRYKGKRILDLFYDSEVDLDDMEELILEGMVNSEMSIYEITDIDPDSQRCRVYLNDLMKPGSYEVINFGFSQTGLVGMVICARLIELEDGLYMTSGATFAFDANAKDRLLADYSFEKFKRRKNLNSGDLFIFCNKKSKVYGKRVQHLDYSED